MAKHKFRKPGKMSEEEALKGAGKSKKARAALAALGKDIPDRTSSSMRDRTKRYGGGRG